LLPVRGDAPALICAGAFFLFLFILSFLLLLVYNYHV